MRVHPSRLYGGARAVLLAALLAAATMAGEVSRFDGETVSARESSAGDSRFVRTALRLQASEPALGAQFAETALDALAAAYAGEAELAREEALAGRGEAQLLDWARAVERYASRITLLREDIAAGYPVQFLRAGDRSLGVSVGDQTVILSHPRVDAQPAFEQSVLATFCGVRDCERWTGSGTPPENEPIPVSAGRVRPVWTFSNDGAICAHGGLEVAFSAGFDVGRARSTCAQFMLEAQTLAVELRWQHQQGVDIDWNGLRLSASPGRPGHTLLLNRAGDALISTLPLIYSSTGLLDALVPWMRSQVGSEEPTTLLLRARALGWENGRSGAGT